MDATVNPSGLQVDAQSCVQVVNVRRKHRHGLHAQHSQRLNDSRGGRRCGQAGGSLHLRR